MKAIHDSKTHGCSRPYQRRHQKLGAGLSLLSVDELGEWLGSQEGGRRHYPRQESCREGIQKPRTSADSRLEDEESLGSSEGYFLGLDLVGKNDRVFPDKSNKATSWDGCSINGESLRGL